MKTFSQEENVKDDDSSDTFICNDCRIMHGLEKNVPIGYDDDVIENLNDYDQNDPVL